MSTTRSSPGCGRDLPKSLSGSGGSTSKFVYLVLGLLLACQYWSYRHCQKEVGTFLVESLGTNVHANSLTRLINIDVDVDVANESTETTTSTPTSATSSTASDSSKEERLKKPSFLRDHYDVCIAGAGLSGAVLAERYATQQGKTVLVVEKREHIGGNCYDYIDVSHF
jgi:hypothetical protein